MAHPKAPFVLSDNRIYDVFEYCACYEEWNFEDELVTRYSVMQRIHYLHHESFNPKKVKVQNVEGLSGSPFAFLVVLPIEDVLDVHPRLPPPEGWIVEVARYSIQSWLENNGLGAHHHRDRAIILRPFS